MRAWPCAIRATYSIDQCLRNCQKSRQFVRESPPRMCATHRACDLHFRVSMKRREFLNRAGMTLFSGVSITILGCGKDDEKPSGTTVQGTQGAVGTISNNHGHSAFITSVQLGSNQAFQLNIQGSATHMHTVSVTPTELTSIRSGKAISKYSTASSDGHSHVVRFN